MSELSTWDVVRRGPWYFAIDELIHRGPDRLLVSRWNPLNGIYYCIRVRLCNYVDRRLGA